MRVTVAVDEALVEGHLPPARADGSGVGVNYADQLLKLLKLTLPDGRKLAAKRRGLRIGVGLGERTGEALLRRLEHGPDPRSIVEQALAAAARDAGVTLTREPGALHLDVP